LGSGRRHHDHHADPRLSDGATMMPVLDLLDGTSWVRARFPAMAREIDSPADELRADGASVKRAANAAVDPRKKNRLERIAKEDQAKAIDIENDFS
jgi:hypothetical protein